MFLSLEIDIKRWQIYTKIHKYTILCKSLVLNRSYSTNTQQIHCHVIQTDTALSLMEVLLHILVFLYKFATVLYQFLETGTTD